MPTVDQSPQLIPFDHLDKVCFVAQNRELGVSFAPVWQLRIRGELEPDVARRAVEVLTRRYPTLAAHAVAIDGKKTFEKAKKLAYQVDPEPTIDRLFTTVDLTDASEADFRQLQQEIFNNHVDLQTDYPIRFTWARTGADEGTLFVQQHHSIADGKCFFDLLHDFCDFYDRAARGESMEAVVAAPKLAEAEVAESNRWRRALYRHLGYWFHLKQAFYGILFRNGQLHSNLSRDYSGNNTVTHCYVPASIVERLRGLRSSTGYSVNDFLATALSIALYRWSTARGTEPKRFNVLVPADARPRGWSGESFGNHLCSFVLFIPARLARRPLDLLRSVSRQTRRQFRKRYHVKALLAGIQMLRLASVGLLKKLIFGAKRAALNFSFSNLIPISPTANGGRFVTGSWRSERLEIMTPCGYLQGVNTTVIRHADQLCFNFNFKDSCVDAASIDDMIAAFHQALEELIAAAGKGSGPSA